MHFGLLAVLASLAGLAAPGGADAAAAYEGATAYRTAVFWNPADRFWTGGLPLESCAASGRHGPATASAVRTAVFEQRGELIGEIRSTPAQAPAVIAQARSCAMEADSAATTYALLSDAQRSWGLFRAAFSACMTRNHSAQYVGSMTLWIDQRCDW